MEFLVCVTANYRKNEGQKDYRQLISVEDDNFALCLQKVTIPGYFEYNSFPWQVAAMNVVADSPEEALVIFERWRKTGIEDSRVF
jgi:hypothetical protein